MKNLLRKNKLGAAMIEYALTLGIFLMMVFGIFEFGLIMALQNGNKAGLYYGGREAMANHTVTINQIRDISITKHGEYAFGSIGYGDIEIQSYAAIEDRVSDISSQIQNNEANASSGIYVYTVTNPFHYITNFFKPSGTSAAITTIETIINEPF